MDAPDPKRWLAIGRLRWVQTTLVARIGYSAGWSYWKWFIYVRIGYYIVEGRLDESSRNLFLPEYPDMFFSLRLLWCRLRRNERK
jgi:hypothetical protein